MSIELAVALAALLGNALVTWGVVRSAVNHALRDVHRAHRRLDAIGAPALTEDLPLQI